MCIVLFQVIIQLANSSNFICEHQSPCHPSCYERQRRSAIRLISALKRVYESEPTPVAPTVVKDTKEEKRETWKEKMKRRVSLVLDA